MKEIVINQSQMEATILSLGGIAGAIAAIWGLGWKFLKPMVETQKKNKADLAAYRKGVAEAIGRLEEKMDNEDEDIAFLQRYELKIAHAQLMQQWWCSAEEKAAVLDLYDHYSGERKRNSQVNSYRKDIESLPASQESDE